MRVDAYGQTDVGRRRSSNEDAVRVRVAADGARPVGVFVVADGVGGRAAGEVASAMFCEAASEAVASDGFFATYCAAQDAELRREVLARLARHVIDAGSAVHQRQVADIEVAGMSTTGVVLLTVDRGAFVAHAGDSRAYLLRGDRVFRLTQDHTLANEMRRRGLLAADDPTPAHLDNTLSRAFGMSPRTEVDLLYVRTESDDRFVLCSDGLHRYVRGSELQELARHYKARDGYAEALIDEANRRGGEDNISVVVVDVSAEGRRRAKRPRVGLGTQIGFMRELFLFRELDEQELMGINRIVHRHRVAAGTPIIREGDPGHSFYLVLSGAAAVSTSGTRLVTLTAGDHFGEMALLDDPPRSADVTAETDMILMSIRREDFDGLLRQDPVMGNKVLVNLLRFMSRRVRSLTSNVRQLSEG